MIDKTLRDLQQRLASLRKCVSDSELLFIEDLFVGVERFANAARLRKAVQEFTSSNRGCALFELPRSDLLISAPDKRSARALAKVLSKAIELLTSGSLNALNKYQDDIEAKCNDLAAAFARNGGAFGMLDLVAYIENLTGADFGLMHLSNLGGFNRALTVQINPDELNLLCMVDAHGAIIPGNAGAYGHIMISAPGESEETFYLKSTLGVADATGVPAMG
jgi:hypothetical protein